MEMMTLTKEQRELKAMAPATAQAAAIPAAIFLNN